MNPHAKRRKLSSPISNSRWLVYTTAGVASALGCASVEAAIVVVDPGIVFDAAVGVPETSAFQLGLANSFAVRQVHDASADGAVLGFAQFGIFNGGAFRGVDANSYHYVSKLAFGDKITGGPFATHNTGSLAAGKGFSNSQWLTAGKGYIGFKFTDAGGAETGWAEIDMTGIPGNDFTLDAYAYSTAGESLTAGQVPEPGSLALLAAGGAGLLAWRHRRAGRKAA